MSNNYSPRGFFGFSMFPPVIKNLLIINAVVFFIQILFDNLTFNGMTGRFYLNQWFALNPVNLFGYDNWPFNFQIWQLITYQFMHGGFTHILFNMFALWMFGMEIENMWGPKKFLLFYLLTGVAAGLLHMFVSPLFGSVPAPTIGASGAVYGVLIAFALFFPDRLIFLYFLIPVKAKYLITFLIVFEFLAVDSAQSSIAHLAHLGGAIAGFLYIMFDKTSTVELKNLFKKSFYYKQSSTKPKRSMFGNKSDVEEANYYDINNQENQKLEVTQEEIDKILDKISQSGYQNLSEREKKVLFEASKKSN